MPRNNKMGKWKRMKKTSQQKQLSKRAQVRMKKMFTTKGHKKMQVPDRKFGGKMNLDNLFQKKTWEK
jgi:hypothetical protein